MTIWQKREKQTRDTQKELKKCSINLRYIGYGFKLPIVNKMGLCSGCRNPDDGELELDCRNCKLNEYAEN